jgi:hypothetical protein
MKNPTNFSSGKNGGGAIANAVVTELVPADTI